MGYGNNDFLQRDVARAALRENLVSGGIIGCKVPLIEAEARCGEAFKELSLTSESPSVSNEIDKFFQDCYADELFRVQMRLIHAEGSGGVFRGRTWCSTLFGAFSLSSPRACSCLGSPGRSLGGIHGGDLGGGSPEVPRGPGSILDRFWIDSGSIQG